MINDLSEISLRTIEDQIRASSIPYDYDTKEYPIEVIVLKFSPSDSQQPTMFIPKYQRDFVWDKKRRCKFIESLILGVPVPPIFVAELDEDGTLEIIDGSQRIRTISEYVNGTLILNDLEELDSLNGTRFFDLLSGRQRKFLNLGLRFHVITDKADLSIRADIFDRLNSNVKTLTPSEIRKGAYATNNFYQFVIGLAEFPKFLEMTEGINYLERQELVLRFFAYSEGYESFKHDVAIFLNRFIESESNGGFSEEVFKTRFESMLFFVSSYFPNGFKKVATSKTIPRVRFEAISVGSFLALEIQPDLVPVNLDWLNQEEFKILTTSDASNNRNKLVNRIQFVRDQLLNR